MHSNLIVARMEPGHQQEVAELFARFDRTDMPGRMGTRRRQLFEFEGLYFHLQDFEAEETDAAIEAAKNDPRFVQVSADLRPFIEPYKPDWASPKDAMARRFYTWEPGR